MTHYPSSSELASFRRSIAGHPDAMVDMHPDAYGLNGAWSLERTHGIGVCLSSRRYDGSGDLAGRYDYFGVIARREASAMRSRAFVRRFGYLDHPEARFLTNA